MNGKTIPSREVFLSSTTLDLAYYRVVAHQVIDKLNDEFNGQYSLTGKSMISEPLSGERETEVEVSRGWVAKADWIVLIVACGTTASCPKASLASPARSGSPAASPSGSIGKRPTR